MNCHKYWKNLKKITNNLSSFDDLDVYGDSVLDEVEIIAHGIWM